MQMLHDGGMVTVYHICQFSSTLKWKSFSLMCLNEFHQIPEGLPEHRVSLMSKLSSLKRENHFLAVFSPMALFPYMAQIFLAVSAAFAPLLNSREEYVGNVPVSPLGTPFYSVHGSTHYLEMTKLQYVNSSTSTELQIKNDNQ